MDDSEQKHKEEVDTLERQLKQLEISQNAENVLLQKKENEKLIEKKNMEVAKKLKKEVKEKLNQKVKQIKLLENERQDNIDKLTKREKDLYKYKFKIKDLQKSKHVLTHRTTEMKASLQPKEAQIEAATEKFSELKEQIEQRIQEVNELGIELTRKQSKIN